jgi:hypothetical protein
VTAQYIALQRSISRKVRDRIKLKPTNRQSDLLTISQESARCCAYRLLEAVLYINSKAQTEFTLEDALGGTRVHLRG